MQAADARKTVGQRGSPAGDADGRGRRAEPSAAFRPLAARGPCRRRRRGCRPAELMRQTRHRSTVVALGYLRPADLSRNSVSDAAVLRHRAGYRAGEGGETCQSGLIVRPLIVHCLRHWVMQHMRVDGFRFDLAAALGGDHTGALLPNPPVLEQIAEDPLLRDTKRVAEVWNSAGALELGTFPRDAGPSGMRASAMTSVACGGATAASSEPSRRVSTAARSSTRAATELALCTSNRVIYARQ